VRRAHLADDITQAVFIILARRAGAVPGEYLPAWLLRTTRYCVRDALKMQARREHHERQAAATRPAASPSSEWDVQQISECLDPAIARLRVKERNAIAMRFLESKSTAEVAAAMGITNDAAQKIIARSLVKLRRILISRGVTVTSVATLAQVLREFSGTGASQAMAETISAAATGGRAAVAPTSIAEGASRMMVQSKAIWIGVAIGLAALAGMAGWTLIQFAATPAVPSVAAAAAAQPFDSPFIELVGCRIKQRLKLDLATNAPLPSVTLNENQYFQIEWNDSPPNAPNVAAYDLSVFPARADIADPQAMMWRVTGIQPDVHTLHYGEAPQKLLPAGAATSAKPLGAGDYRIQLVARSIDAVGQESVQTSTLPFKVVPYGSMQISMMDLQTGQTFPAFSVLQDFNRGAERLDVLGFQNPVTAPAISFADEDGRPMETTQEQLGDTVYYHPVFPRPIEPGAPMMFNVVVTQPPQIENSDHTFTYQTDTTPLPPWPMRVIHVFRLPPGASVVSTDPPNTPQRIVDGQVQIYVEKIVPPNGLNTLTIRYKLAGSNAQ